MLGSFVEYFIANEVDGDREGTASRIAAALKLTNHQRSILLSLIEDGCRILDRSRTRVTESEGRAGRRVVDPAGERAAYLAERFAVGDGRMVTWGEATIGDHQARIEFLELMRGGITTTIERHVAAVSELIAHGASCLNDITVEEAVAA